MVIPLIILLIELSVSNAYLGILLASLPEVRTRYGRYLLSNASMVLLGLTASLIWLVWYRYNLSRRTRHLDKLAKRMEAETGDAMSEQQPHMRDPEESIDSIDIE